MNTLFIFRRFLATPLLQHILPRYLPRHSFELRLRFLGSSASSNTFHIPPGPVLGGSTASPAKQAGAMSSPFIHRPSSNSCTYCYLQPFTSLARYKPTPTPATPPGRHPPTSTSPGTERLLEITLESYPNSAPRHSAARAFLLKGYSTACLWVFLKWEENVTKVA